MITWLRFAISNTVACNPALLLYHSCCSARLDSVRSQAKLLALSRAEGSRQALYCRDAKRSLDYLLERRSDVHSQACPFQLCFASGRPWLLYETHV
jgi:hypothetical protein